MPYTNEHDASKQKTERRRELYKIARRRKAMNILATNYPGPTGQKFITDKLVGSLRAKVTLVDKLGFTKGTAKKLGDSVTLVPHTDIFFQMLSNEYDFLDIDLCGGLSTDAIKSIESCTSWKTIVLTATDKFRSRWGNAQPAKPAGVHLQKFIFDWCEKNSWGCKLSFSPKPYRRYNKNNLLGIADGRGPWYYTFIITRN